MRMPRAKSAGRLAMRFKLASRPLSYHNTVMKNKKALALAAAAAKYRDSLTHDSKSYGALINQDYEDLMSIAQMIESDEPKERVARAMWRLDTLVRDVIPDSVYNTYSK